MRKGISIIRTIPALDWFAGVAIFTFITAKLWLPVVPYIGG